MRTYTNKEMMQINEIVRAASAHADNTVSFMPYEDLEKARWNAMFHEKIEAECCAAGLRKPRSFFEKGAEAHGFDRD